MGEAGPGGRIGLVTEADVARWVPPRAADAHKWRSAVVMAAGSAEDDRGAARRGRRCGRGRGWSGWRRPASTTTPALPTEAVGIAVPAAGWDSAVSDQLDRAGAFVVGPGLGRSAPAEAAVHHLVAGASVPTVVDGDALSALRRHGRGGDRPGARAATPWS